MQLMCDAISVLGSRHGLLWDPVHRRCGIIRFDAYHELPELQLRAGVVVEGKEYLLPLCAEGGQFRFHDQRLSPCTMTMMGIDPASMVKLKLRVVTPFRPRDAAFSTTPVLALRLGAEKLPGVFRWERKTVDPKEVEIFVEFGGPAVAVEQSSPDCIDLRFASKRTEMGRWTGQEWEAATEEVPQCDRVVALTGQLTGTRFSRRVSFEATGDNALDLAWCVHSGPTLEIMGKRHPFKYASAFASLDAVAEWARRNPTAILDNAAAVEGIIAANNASKSVNNLLAQTLHSWLINTWWVERDGRDWFSVWEGDCYYHSTVDVEYTQAPFYLAVWPELLRMELDAWPEYSKDGSLTLGAKGKGTLFLSHDMGSMESAHGQGYPHEMEVEENANYVILSYAYYRRSGDDSTIRAHGETLEKYLEFLIAADSTGNGVPDQGVANTIDDASPAVQFGREQVYLAVKTLAAFATGAEMMHLLDRPERAAQYRAAADRVRKAIEERGWLGDHYATLLEKRGTLKNPWSGEVIACEEIPGWDAAHIYTCNGIALLDMVGFSVGLKEERLKGDLVEATRRCLREYGCVHSDFSPGRASLQEAAGLAGAAPNPGWIAMNMLRDLAAFYRGIDLRYLTDRYWEWQVTTNTQQPHLFFETFGGNNLCFYPRGVAIWGFFDALAGLMIDRIAGMDEATRPLPQVRVPRLLDADWVRGKSEVIRG
jgi:hypothetical protein